MSPVSLKSIGVFCGSSSGNDSEYIQTARLVGQYLAQQNIEVVYGGANVGLMRAVADGAIEKKGKVIGVLPRFLEKKELAHKNLTELILCDSMHERKTKMFQLAQGFIALPGGLGTLEEVCEMLTWQQLGMHQFPIGFLNVKGFYDSLLTFFKEMVKREFLKSENLNMALFSDNPVDLIHQMKIYRPASVEKWISRSQV